MSNNNNTKKVDVPALSDRDMEMLIAALRCAEGGFPKVDYKKFAEMAGFKNANSASVSFGHVKKKVMGEPGSTKSTPKKQTPSKRKQPTFEGANADDDDDETPTKKVKTSSKKAPKKEKKVKEESDEDESTVFV